MRLLKVIFLSLMSVISLTACSGGESSGALGTSSNTTLGQGGANQAPSIQLLGEADLSINQGETFNDPGATASDTEDGDLSASIRISGIVDTTTPGTYTLVYQVTDAGGLAAQVTRDVIIAEQVETGRDVTARLEVLSRAKGVSPETVYFSAQSSNCSDCSDVFELDTQLANAWSALSYHFTFDDGDSGNYTTTGNSRNAQLSGSPRSFHTFECHGEADPNWSADEQLCVFNVGVRVQAQDGDHSDDFVRVTIQPQYGAGAYYESDDTWCVSGEGDFTDCPHSDGARHINDSPAPGAYADRLILYARGSSTTYAPICVGADEQNVTVAAYGTGARPLVERIQHSTRPGSCLSTYTDTSISTVSNANAPQRDSSGDLDNGYGFNATFTGLRVGSIINGPSYHLANFHDLDMNWESSGAYNGEIVVHRAAWNCKNSSSLSCSNVPYAAFGSFTSIVSKSHASNLAPVTIACFDGCGATNFVFADIEVNRSFEHNARFMGLWGAIFSNVWLRGNHVGGNGGKERLTVRPIEVLGSQGGTLHDLAKNPELLDGHNNFRSEETTGDYYNRYNVAVDNIFNQASQDANHDSAAMLHLGGNYTGEFGSRFIADDSGELNFQTQLTGRYKIIRETQWAEGYPRCSLRTNFYPDNTPYNDASSNYVESPTSCSGSFNWPEGIEPLSYGLPPGS